MYKFRSSLHASTEIGTILVEMFRQEVRCTYVKLFKHDQTDIMQPGGESETVSMFPDTLRGYPPIVPHFHA